MISHHVEVLKSYFKKYYAPGLRYKRFGSQKDGGYIMADDISDKDFGISFGIENNVDWEKDFLSKGSGLHAYDNSINALPEILPNTVFFKETIGSSTGLSDVLLRVTNKKNLILKMDIEGAELGLLDNAEQSDLLAFRQIIVEFHWLRDYFNNEEFRLKFDRVMAKILKTHSPVWIHANNCSGYYIADNQLIPDVVEVLFLRKSSYNIRKYPNQFEGLDFRNNPNRPALDLAFG